MELSEEQLQAILDKFPDFPDGKEWSYQTRTEWYKNFHLMICAFAGCNVTYKEGEPQ